MATWNNRISEDKIFIKFLTEGLYETVRCVLGFVKIGQKVGSLS
jgi:hypothetical protein